MILKEYYEIVNEARPLSGFFSTDAAFFISRNAVLIMKLYILAILQVSERSEL